MIRLSPDKVFGEHSGGYGKTSNVSVHPEAKSLNRQDTKTPRKAICWNGRLRIIL